MLVERLGERDEPLGGGAGAKPRRLAVVEQRDVRPLLEPLGGARHASQQVIAHDVAQRIAEHHRAQRGERARLLGGIDANAQIGVPWSVGVPDVDGNDGPAGAPARDVQPRGLDEAREEARVAGGRVGGPTEDGVGTVAQLAEGERGASAPLRREHRLAHRDS